MIPGSANPLLLATAAGAAGYQIRRSLRFNSADSAYLSRTPASAGNRKTWTWAGWVKRVSSARQYIFGTADSSGNNSTWIEFEASGIIRFGDYTTSYIGRLETTQFFRDFSAWGHVVAQMDTTQATASERMKLFWNGVQITSFGTATYPAQNTDSQLNTTTAHSIGRGGTWNTNYLSAYLADVFFVDGQALDPTSFGEFDDNGIWQPIAYTGSYGTNGFHLDFADNSSAAALGYDAAGSNDWTVNNLSVTAGAGNDSLVDSPTNYGTDTGAGGEVRGNYCTMSPLQLDTITLANGSLDINRATGGSWKSTIGTLAMPTSGKWYFEATLTGTTLVYVGLVAADAAMATLVSSYPVNTQVAYTIYPSDSNVYSGPGNNNDGSSGLGSFSTGDVVQVLYDADNGNLKFGKNNTLMASNAYTGLSTRDYLPVIGTNPTGLISVNFGQRAFAYSAPSGYTALCTQNAPTPTIEDGSTAMDVVTYTGNGSTQTISGLNFSPDFIWTKGRNNTEHNTWVDVLRPTSRYLYSSLSAEESPDQPNGVTSFNSDGYSIGSSNYINRSAYTYVGWCWDAGSSNATNTDGSITSTVRANASAGISIISYTGTGTAGTIGHGLGVTPGMVIVKGRGITGTSDAWATYMTGASATAGAYLLLEKTSTVATSSVVFNSTNPTSSVFSVGTWNGTNKSGVAFISYAFAPVSGFSIMGKYTGNGNADGPFVYTGFRPAFVLVKMSSSIGNWTILDRIREGYNVDNDPLYPNLSNAEGTTDLVDITSNGFKVRTTDATFNTNAGTYVYAAFAENPFSLARAR
jgi:hypothetical protein